MEPNGSYRASSNGWNAAIKIKHTFCCRMEETNELISVFFEKIVFVKRWFCVMLLTYLCIMPLHYSARQSI